LQDLDAILGTTNTPRVDSTVNSQNEMERYLDGKEVLPVKLDILECWQFLEPQYPTVARMAKDILAIPLAGVGVERVFNLGRDTCNYRRGHLHGETIKKIMIVKHAHQKDMIDEILLSEMELKKEAMNDDKNSPEAEEDNYLVGEEEKLAQSCHFDYQETAQAAAKEAAMEKAREIAREADQRRFRVGERRSARTLDSGRR